MKLKQLFTDDDAVSPVIGVILMVAITVILAAVIAALVLGLGDEPQQTPSAQFEFDYDDSPSNPILAIEHNGGNSVAADEMEVRGNGLNNISSGDAWHQIHSNVYTADSDISTGNDITFTVDSDYDVTLTWVPPGGGDTAPLASDEGPDA